MHLRGFLFLAFLAVPIAEIALLIWVGGRIGLGVTLVLILATAALGAYFVSEQGRGVSDEIRARFLAGSFPGRELAHGGMILVAGALLLTPGFLTDAVGFLLLVPAVRETVRRRAVRRYGTGRIIEGN